MDVRILGPLEVVASGRVLEIRGQKQRALLGILLIHANEVISPDALADALWADEPPPSASKTLQAHISRLRDALDDVSGDDGLTLQTHGHGYRLVVERAHLDAKRFEELVETGRRQRAGGDAKGASETIRRGLDLWRGPALVEFADEPFAQHEIARLEELRLSAVEDRVEADLDLGRHRELIADLEAFVRREPLRERARGQLMLALYRSGRQAEALRVYQEGRRQLADDLGVEPSVTLQDLERRILHQDPDLEAPTTMERPALVVAGRPLAIPRWMALSVALLIGVLVGAAAWAVGGPKPAKSGAGLAVFSGAAAQLVGNVQFGTSPFSLAVDDDSVWVVDADDRTVTQVDATSRAVRRIFNTAKTPTDIAVGAGAVWIGNANTPLQVTVPGSMLPISVDRLDPATGDIVTTIPLRPGLVGQIYGVLAGISRQHITAVRDAVWVINADQTVSRIDPGTNAVVATVEDVKAENIGAGEGQVWVTEGNSIAEIDPSTNQVARRVDVSDDSLSDIAIGAGSVWAADPLGGAVWRYKTNTTGDPKQIEVAPWVAGLSFGSGGVWATSEIGDEVYRIDPLTDAVSLVGTAPAPRDVDASHENVWITAASPPSEDAALPSGVCSDIQYDGPGQPDLLVTSNLPLEGAGRPITTAIVDGIRFALERRDFRAGSHRVGYQSCDTSTAQTGESDFFRCASNAKAQARNLRVVGVIGAFESSCSYPAIPIGNEAPNGPLVSLSPSNTEELLTLDRDLYPTGVQSYARIASPNRYEGSAHVRLAHALGKSRLAIVESEAGEYGPRFIEHIEGTARELGVEIVEHTMATLDESSAGPIAEGVVVSNADAVTIVGILDRGTAALIRELRQRLGQDFPIITPDGFMLPEDLVALAGPAAQGVYSTVYGIPNGELPKRGRDFIAEYERSRGTPIGADLGAVYGGQAAEILLDAIGVSDGTRASVTREVMKTDEPDGLIGAIAFDEFGELEEPPVTIMRFTGDDFELDRVVKTKNVSPTS